MKITISTNDGAVIDVITDDEWDGLSLPQGFTWTDARSLGSTLEAAILEALRDADKQENDRRTCAFGFEDGICTLRAAHAGRHEDRKED